MASDPVCPPRPAGFVGNDVVDYGDPSLLARHLRRRFVERICAPEEQTNLAMSARPGPCVCALLAAKEAAYKVVAKLEPGVVFAHRRFVVSARFDAVDYDGSCMPLRLVTGDDWAHALVWFGGGAPLFGIRRTNGDDPGTAARRCMYERLARRTGRPASDFTIVREARPGGWDGFGPPKLTVRGIAQALDASLSHDGRWVAFAVVRSPALAPASARGSSVRVLRENEQLQR